MNKKVLSLVLALVIVLGSFGTLAQAATATTSQDQKIQWLIDNGVVAGRTVNADGSADLALDKTITRAEVTKLVVYSLKLQNLADILKGVMQPFPDVTLEHWANGYISVATTQRADIANGRRIIIGFPDGRFYPENNVTYGELSAMLVRIVKKDLTAEMERNAIWATSYVRWAQEEGILDGVTITDSNAPAIRKDAFVMIYNALHKMGNANYNAPKFGDVMGIVSKAQAGIIQLNQDPKMQYKITFNSRVTDGTTWADVAANSIQPGSLVRLIANADGEIVYLMELGSPRVGAHPAARWFDVAKKSVSTRDFGTNTAVAGDGYFFDEYFKKIFVNGVEATIDSDTRFFVADVSKNALKEIDNLADVFRYYVRDYKDLNKVYMGYDDFQGRNEAKVIVFGEVDKYQGGTAIRRVVGYYATNYNIVVETTKGVHETISYENTSYFPRQGYVDKMDVVKLYLNYENAQSEYGNLVPGGTTFTNYPLGTVKHANGSVGGYEVIIDYSADPVYNIKSVNLAERRIELEDEFGYARSFYIKDADVFLEGQARKGAHVQVVLSADKTEVDVVSVVDKALKGALPEGVRRGMEDGYIVRYQTLADGRMTVTIAMDRLSNGEYRNLKTYEVATDWRQVVRDYGVGEHIVYDIGDKFGATPYIYNVEKWYANGVQPGTGLLPRLNPTTLSGVAEKGQLESGEYNRDAITIPQGDAWHKLPRYSEVVLTAPAPAAGQVLTGFKVEGEAVKIVENLAERKISFQMPRTGDVKVSPVYAAAANATVENTGACDINVVAVNGVKITELAVPAGQTRDSYTLNGETVNFKIGDKIIVAFPKNEDGTCGTADCKLEGFKVKGLCAAGNTVNAGTLPLITVNPGPCGGSECEEIKCAAELTLSCVTQIEAFGRSIESGLRTFAIQKVADTNEYVITPTDNNPFYEFENMKYDPKTGSITGKVKLTQAGIDAGAKLIANQPVQVEGGTILIDPDTVRVEGTNISFRVQGCQEGCTGEFQIRIWMEVDCVPCAS